MSLHYFFLMSIKHVRKKMQITVSNNKAKRYKLTKNNVFE